MHNGAEGKKSSKKGRKNPWDFGKRRVFYTEKNGEGGGAVGEQEIVALLRGRDEQGVEQLLARYGPLMRYVIAPILPNAQDREECLCEAALLVWNKIDAYDSQKGSWTTWLTVLTRNAALNRARGQRGGAEELSDRLPSEEDSPEEALLRKERLAVLREAIRRLPREEQRLFYRKYYYCQPTAQMAAELGMTERAVEGRLYRIRRKLRERLGGDTLDGTGF